MVFLEWVGSLVEPCFDCNLDRVQQRSHKSSALRTLRTPGHEVELAVSPLAGLRGFAGYHTSVLVAGEEYYFSPVGISCSPKLSSHESTSALRLEFVGLSQYSGTDLLDVLSEHFKPGTYDLLRKNCNSFSDCAIFFLCGQRLESGYRSIERLGRAADDHAGLVQSLSRGEYRPNQQAASFDLDQVIMAVGMERWRLGAGNSDGSEIDEDEIWAYRDGENGGFGAFGSANAFWTGKSAVDMEVHPPRCPSVQGPPVGLGLPLPDKKSGDASPAATLLVPKLLSFVISGASTHGDRAAGNPAETAFII